MNTKAKTFSILAGVFAAIIGIFNISNVASGFDYHWFYGVIKLVTVLAFIGTAVFLFIKKCWIGILVSFSATAFAAFLDCFALLFLLGRLHTYINLIYLLVALSMISLPILESKKPQLLKIFAFIPGGLFTLGNTLGDIIPCTAGEGFISHSSWIYSLFYVLFYVFVGLYYFFLSNPADNQAMQQPDNIQYQQPYNIQYQQPYNMQYQQPYNMQYQQPYSMQYQQPNNMQYQQPYNMQYQQLNNMQYQQPIPMQYQQPAEAMQQPASVQPPSKARQTDSVQPSAEIASASHRTICYCTSCGAQNSSDNHFCVNCGQPLQKL